MNININPNLKENTEGIIENVSRAGIDKTSAGRKHLNIHA